MYKFLIALLTLAFVSKAEKFRVYVPEDGNAEFYFTEFIPQNCTEGRECFRFFVWLRPDSTPKGVCERYEYGFMEPPEALKERAIQTKIDYFNEKVKMGGLLGYAKTNEEAENHRLIDCD